MYSCLFVFLQFSLLLDLFVQLQLIVDLEVFKVFEANATFSALAHFLDVLFDVLERVDFAYT